MRTVGASVIAAAVLAAAANTFIYSVSDDSCIGLVGSSDDGSCSRAVSSMAENVLTLSFAALSLKALFSQSVRPGLSEQLRQSRRCLAQIHYDKVKLLAAGSIVVTLMSFCYWPPHGQRLQTAYIRAVLVVLSAALVFTAVDPSHDLSEVFAQEGERCQNQLAEQAADEPLVGRVEMPRRFDMRFLPMADAKRPDGDADLVLRHARLRADRAEEALRRLQADLPRAQSEMQAANQALQEAQRNALYANERRRAELGEGPAVRRRIPRRLGLVSQSASVGEGAVKMSEGDTQDRQYSP